MRRIEVVRGSLHVPRLLRARLRLRPGAAPARDRRRAGDVPGGRRGCASCARSTGTLEADGRRRRRRGHARPRRARLVRALASASPGRAWDEDAVERDVRRDGRVLARLDRAEPLPRSLARDGRPLGDHAQAAHLPADGRRRRGPDDEPARAHRRAAQLGLPLLLAARLGVHDVRVPAPGLPRRGAELPDLAARARQRPRGRRAAPGHVRRSTGAASSTEEELPHLAGYRGSGPVRIGNGASDAAPAGRLRRGRRRGLPGRARRHAALLRALGQAALDPRLARRQLGSAGRGHLGGARRPPRLHLLADHDLGRVRPRDPHPDQARPAGRHRALARGARRRLRVGDDARLVRGAPVVQPVRRQRRARRERPDPPARAHDRARPTRACSRRSTPSATTS